MDTLFAPFRQVLTKLCLLTPPQTRKPFPGQCCLGRVGRHHSTQILISHPNGLFFSILEFIRHDLRTTHGFTLVTPSLRGGRHLQRAGPSTTLEALGFFHQRRHKSRVSLVPMTSQAFLMERCATYNLRSKPNSEPTF
jgi:hypothetical protein